MSISQKFKEFIAPMDEDDVLEVEQEGCWKSAIGNSYRNVWCGKKHRNENDGRYGLFLY